MRCDAFDLVRLEVPIDWHRLSTQHHGRVACFEKGNVVAHQNANAIAFSHTNAAQSLYHQRDPSADVVEGSMICAADDTFGYCHVDLS